MQTAERRETEKERGIYPNLKLRMYTTGMRQNRLAKLLGIDEAYLSRIVNGVRAPRRQTRQEIAMVLGCDAEWLFKRATIGGGSNLTGWNTELGNKVLAED
ncbi:MAG: helix-turn-helix transcriptional regulator [Terracidiphilus sp.]|jgi:transcriptional regulator with XRE-family HTH domain